MRITITPGQIADFLSLAPLHYLAARPATFDAILCARHHDQCAGVLVVSRPTLCAWWRPRAWGRQMPRERVAAARWLNQNVRTISRVIVAPAFRGLSVGSGLVRAYLARPRTRYTEAPAAMGVWSPFFERAGMRRLTAPPDPHDARLAADLRTLGIAPSRLVRAEFAERVLRRPDARRVLERRCRGRRWPTWSTSDLAVLGATIARRTTTRRIAYVAGR